MELNDSFDRTTAMFGTRRIFNPPDYKPAIEARKKAKKQAFAIPSTKHMDPEPIEPVISLQEKKVEQTLLLTDDTNQSSSSILPPTPINPDNALVALPPKAPTTHTAPSSSALVMNNNIDNDEIQYHAEWELDAVISGHLGWVRSIAFDPTNEWFATGSADRTIKIWDLAKCVAGSDKGLKLTLTGHIGPVRGLAVSDRHPYLFSAGEDKQVKCWDLETNKVIRHYHGHLSGIYCMSLHPTLDILVTGGRDSVARVWDMRTKKEVHVLGGHSNTIGALATFNVDPQIISGSYDSTIKLWDLVAGRSMTTLTHHKKGVRALSANTQDLTFLSGAADNIKKWQVRDGKFLKNFSGQQSIINTISTNDDGVAVSGGDNGTLYFWDANSGNCFQKIDTIVQPGSLDVEAGIYASSFDLSGSRFLTCEADKSIKIYKEKS